MQLTPRYDSDPLIVLEGPVLEGAPGAVCAPAIAQRRRLADLLGSFDDSQWEHPSRCEGWTARDVIVHLDSTNAFWTYSIQSGLAGEPTRLMAKFDPVSSPAELVSAAADVTSAEVLHNFVSSTDTLVALLESLGVDDWEAVAEAPPGHLSVSAVVHHALWDSWVHERDILLPLGESPLESADEIRSILRYAIALSPAFVVAREAALDPGQRRTGRLGLSVVDPEVTLVADIGTSVVVRDVDGELSEREVDLLLRGDAADLLEALSIRRPLDQSVGDSVAWMLSGLPEVFNSDVS